MKAGDAWLAADEPDKAAESWEAVVADHPADLLLRRRIAETYLRTHLTDRALFHYEYIAGHDAASQRAEALREIGLIRENRGEFDAARDAYERALQLTARDNWLHGELLSAIIRLYERAGRGTELAERWRREAAQAPRDLGGLLRLEKLSETFGDTRGQREWLEKIVALVPRDQDSRLRLARLLANLGERDKAAAAYDSLLGEQPDRLDLLFARADLDIQAGQLDEATQRLENRLAATPTDETVSAPILEFFLAHRLDGPAERLLGNTLARHPSAAESCIALAKFYLTHRRIREAREILENFPEKLSTEAARTDWWRQVAVIYRDAELPEDALRTWQKVEAATPDDAAPKMAMAELLLGNGQTNPAVDELEKATNLLLDGAERETVEHRLFEVLSSAHNETLLWPKVGRSRTFAAG